MRRRGRRRLLHLLSLLLGLGMVVAIGWHAGLPEVLGDIATLSPLILLPLCVVYGISWVFRGLRQKAVLAIMGARAGFLESTGMELMSDLANHVIPAKLGDAVKVVYVRRRGYLGTGRAVFAAFLVRVSDLVAVMLMTLASLVFVSASTSSRYGSLLMVMSGLLALIVASGTFFLLYPERMSRLLRGPLARFRPSVMELSSMLTARPLVLAGVLGQSLLVWVFDILTLFVFLQAFGVRLGFPETAFVLLLSNLMKVIPLTPNGLGLYEGAMVVLLGAFGVERSMAFSIGVLDHGFMNLFSLALSFVAVYTMGLGLAGLRKMASEREAEAGRGGQASAR